MIKLSIDEYIDKLKEVLDNAPKYICIVRRFGPMGKTCSLVTDVKDLDSLRSLWSNNVIDVLGGFTLEEINDFMRSYMTTSEKIRSKLSQLVPTITGKHVDIGDIKGLYEINSDQFKDYLVHVLQSSWITFKDVPREEIIGDSFELLAEKYEVDKTDIIKTFEEALEDRSAILTWITKN